ncbi:Uncharacterized conserved protein, DUF952 family [Bradyrhizobium lablabi]|uniref:Uncharacterized conserved protein, DUF952 family n=2 Tax=Bradyrhizobium TaxID=374 RepID=A0ABY0PJI0_9BRAD|nr:Uncharacterized conserved protein, DUF952 family [Bradyrhizobium ottawaense]SED44098.1 Uncharacterized conserved protein, DUF952 family [Bradyrhizobium lablabi]SHL43088.1 Uncharacterized conserved protein, DUF952 family [Bradyrhizobium lablabi]
MPYSAALRKSRLPRRLSWRPAAITVCACPGYFRENPKSNNNKQGIRNAVPTIYKISPASAWREAERQGVYKGSADDLRDGFIHFSTAAQVAETARKHYFGQTGLFLIAVDAEALGDALRWERSRNDELFPHLYGELDIGAVTAILDMRARSDGYHDIPELKP